jgi:hypothetical protein
VEAEAALERPEGRVELDAEAAVDLDVVLVVDPRHAEDDLTLGLADALEHGCVDVLGVLLEHRPERVEDLANRLVELDLTRVAGEDLVEDGLQTTIHGVLLGRAGFEPHQVTYS